MKLQARVIAAWAVHAYTIFGGVLGLLAMLAVAEGEIRIAFLLLLFSVIIDATDGMLARRVNVKEVLPTFDGAEVDNIIDAFTYGWLPFLIIGTQDLLPNPIWLVFPAVALCYAYGQVNMKTSDSFFLGFPSYWNVIALYLYWLQPIPVITVALIVIPAILTFIPTRYLYPSKNQVLWKTSWGLGAIWFALLVVLLLQETPNQTWVMISLFYPAYYMIASFYVDWTIRRASHA